jgi:hypothetical protein
VVMAHWADRALFKRVVDRIHPDMPRDLFSAYRMLARAVVLLAIVLGLTLGI